jgi:Protein of unknown function (DUF3146)
MVGGEPRNGDRSIVSGQNRPESTAYVRIIRQSWQHGRLEGEVRTAGYEWRFQWHFRQGRLTVQPSLGRAVIFEPLNRFLERNDYQLEPGGDYQFTLRSKL